MARLNIEECWWSDIRRSALIRLMEDEDLADAAAIRAWRLAQEFWSKGREYIPRHIWASFQAGAKLIQAGLAEERENGIYVRGSSQYLEWANERRKAGQVGGKKSAERPRNAKGQLQKAPKQKPSSDQAESNQSQSSDSFSDSSSSSDSSSGSDSNHATAADAYPAPSAVPLETLHPAKQVIARYCDRWREKHGGGDQIPPIVGKDAGIVTRLLKSLSADKLYVYLDAYFQMPDAYVVKAKHPLELFEARLKEIAAFADSGKFITLRQAAQADDMAGNMLLLQKIRGGQG